MENVRTDRIYELSIYFIRIKTSFNGKKRDKKDFVIHKEDKTESEVKPLYDFKGITSDQASMGNISFK